jgi:hypothetical protein
MRDSTIPQSACGRDAPRFVQDRRQEAVGAAHLDYDQTKFLSTKQPQRLR